MSSGDIPSTSSTLPPVLCRLSVGHHAEKMPEKIGSRTHRWKVFVRAPEGYPEFTDRSFIRKVTFKLHKTFDNPERVVRKPPFEVRDTAYGCFFLLITVQFRNVNKTYPLNYDMSLPIKKKSVSIQQDQFIEITNPPSREFIDLALKYGGKLKNPSSIHHDIPKVNTTLLEIDARPNNIEVNEERTSTSDKEEKHFKKHSKHKKRDRSKEHRRKRDSSHNDSDRNRGGKRPRPRSPDNNFSSDHHHHISSKHSSSNHHDSVRERFETRHTESVEYGGDKERIKEPSPKRFKHDEMKEKKFASTPDPSSSMHPNVYEEATEKLSKPTTLPQDITRMTEILEQQVAEMTKAPVDPISPISMLRIVKNEESDEGGTDKHSPTTDRSGPVKNDEYWKNFNKIRSLLIRPVRREKYSLSFLRTLDGIDDDIASCFERPIPRLKFCPEFMKIQFKKEDMRKQFDQADNNDEPQLFRLIKQNNSPVNTEDPPENITHANIASLSDRFD